MHRKDILDEWGMYLQVFCSLPRPLFFEMKLPAQQGEKSSASRHVLVTHELGWFCPTAIQAPIRCANDSSHSNHTFDEFYDCDSNDAHYGFKSWDGKCCPFSPFRPSTF